ncbi:MAG TPA: hypothetical protein DCE61_08015, partial [Cellvibrionales bacterium]|nr:hypothetical protein [Cellvibrionales bacterium]
HIWVNFSAQYLVGDFMVGKVKSTIEYGGNSNEAKSLKIHENTFIKIIIFFQYSIEISIVLNYLCC